MSAYAKIVDDLIVAYGLPAADRRLSDGVWVCPFNGQWSVGEHESCGWFLIDESAVQPADTATTFFESEIQVVAGRPVRVWVEHNKSAERLTLEQRAANESALRTQARNALAGNDTFLAIPSPTNVQVRNQTIALTQQVSRIIRLIVGSDLLD